MSNGRRKTTCPCPGNDENDQKVAILTTYACSIGVNVRFLSKRKMDEILDGSRGAFNPDSMSISVIKDLKKEKLLCVMLHELGHAEDWLSMTKKEKIMSLTCLYIFSAFIDDGRCVDGKIASNVLSFEQNAWKNARSLNDCFRIGVSKRTFYDNERSCRSRYKDMMKGSRHEASA